MRSTQTITDLKLQLMQKTKQSPNDQLLYLNNKALESDQTLEAARVAANNFDNPLVLIVQQRRVEVYLKKFYLNSKIFKRTWTPQQVQQIQQLGS